LITASDREARDKGKQHAAGLHRSYPTHQPDLYPAFFPLRDRFLELALFRPDFSLRGLDELFFLLDPFPPPMSCNSSAKSNPKMSLMLKLSAGMTTLCPSLDSSSIVRSANYATCDRLPFFEAL
jgi:hypothetical protein